MDVSQNWRQDVVWLYGSFSWPKFGPAPRPMPCHLPGGLRLENHPEEDDTLGRLHMPNHLWASEHEI